MYPAAPKSVSSDFGQLAVSRHFSSGIDWATAGAATADVASPTPAALRNSRRFMLILPWLCRIVFYLFWFDGCSPPDAARRAQDVPQRAACPARTSTVIDRRKRNVYRNLARPHTDGWHGGAVAQ